MWLLLFVPVVILVVLVLSVSALFAGVFWILGASWPVLLIGLGIWMFWHEDGRHSRRERWRSGPRAVQSRPSPEQRRQTGQPKDKHSTADAATQPLRQPELPIDVQVKVE